MLTILLFASTVVFKGMTFIDKPIVLTPEDSGKVFIGEEGAVVSGGVKLGPWKDRGDGVWEAPSPGFFFDQLWIDGRRAPCARLPAEGYLTIAGGEQRDFADADAKRLGYLQEVTFTNDVVDALGEIASDELKYVQMSVIVKWSYARRTLYGYDKTKRRVSTLFREPWVAEGTNHLEWDPKFTLVAFENVRTAFRNPGQWFLDVKGGKVLYRPLAGETPEALVAYAPRHGLSSLVEIRGDPARGRYVENVAFRNISFEHASFDVRPGEESGPHQIAQFQAASTDGGTIHAVGARNCLFENCRVAHTANHAFRLDDGCVSNRIVDCTMEDIGAGGVWMGEREPRSTAARPIVGRRFVFPTARTSTAFNLVSNCTIRTGGRYNPEGCGVAIADCSDSKVIHCDITDMRYTGVSVGWTQGYQGSVAQRNEIAFNHIWNIGLGLMSDMSGVYLLGTSFGTTVHDNVVHDVRTYAYGGSGLYCDEGTEGVILERNVVWNTTDSNFYEHFGEGNIVRNNIFAWNREYSSIRFYRVHKHGVPSSLDFVNNIVLSDGCRLTSPDASRIFGTWANNVWYDLKGKDAAVFDGLGFDKWLEARHETGSVFADPKFVDAKGFDFRLEPDSPALALGFRPWDFSAAGRRHVAGGAGLLDAGANLITNPDMAMDDGVGIPAGWGTRVFPAETGGKISAEPISNGVFRLTVKGRKSSYWWEQGGLTLVPGARYRLSCEARTSGLDGGKILVYARNREWNWNSKALDAPSDTKGEWTALSCEFEAHATKHTNNYWVALCARAGKGGGSKVEFRKLKLEAADPAAQAVSRPMSPENLKKLAARIVPVDPLLSRVDAATGRMRFYWARASRSPACTLSCRLDEANARATAAFDAKDYASVALGKMSPGEHRLSVVVNDSAGAVLASNAYRIVAGTWKDPGKVGRRLNNLVTELVNAPLKDGEVTFERAVDGWTWISFDGDIGEAKGYLDGGADCAVCRREGEPFVETQRYLKAGMHTLRIRDAKGGRLRIHAVKIVMGGSLKGYDRKASAFGSFGGFIYGLPFLRKYGLLSSVNVISSDGKFLAHELADPFATTIWNCLARGMQITRSTMFSPLEKDRLSEEATYRHIDNALWDGFVASVSVDENALRAPSLHSVNFSEAVWRIHAENPQNALNLFYCDTSEGVVYDEPRQNVSEIASVVNTGDGRGLLCPEFYMPVTPDRAAFRDFIDANANFIASALEMVPASRGKTIMYGASYIMLGEWCNYYAPETDIKVHTADLMRAYAVDPRFAECAGVGFGGVDRGNEEYVRWSMKLVRYYALEGGTEDLAAKYGYAWNPGFVKDPDFAKGFESWQAKPAEAGGLAADRIRQYGMRYQHRVGAPAGFGDTMAKFTVSKSGPNILSQKLTGLKPGAYYSLQFNLTDRMPPDEKGDMWNLRKRPLVFAARLEGAQEVRELGYDHPLLQDAAASEEDRRRSMMHNMRYVFRATAPEATLVFTDREGSGPTVDVGRTYLLNYVIFAPYYCEGEADVRDIAATILGKTGIPGARD